jgi:magnesium transporter
MKNCQLYKYNENDCLVEVNDADFFSKTFNPKHKTNTTHWLNFHSITDRPSIENLCNALEIEKLCIETIFTAPKRAKVEEYENYMFFSIKSALPSSLGNKLLDSEQITFVLNHDYLISFQEKVADHFDSTRDRIVNDRGIIRKKSTDFLLFRLLESIVDNYYCVIDDINDRISKLDSEVHTSEDGKILKKIEDEKRKLIELRKIAIPMRDITIQLENATTPFIHAGNSHYFSNLKFLCESLLEEIDALKQILDGISNMYYAAQGQRMNKIMKVLTVISAIFIPLTFIAGVYGMNFENMPELKWSLGYFAIISLMVTLAAALFFYFWKKKWFD